MTALAVALGIAASLVIVLAGAFHAARSERDDWREVAEEWSRWARERIEEFERCHE